MRKLKKYSIPEGDPEFWVSETGALFLLSVKILTHNNPNWTEGMLERDRRTVDKALSIIRDMERQAGYE